MNLFRRRRIRPPKPINAASRAKHRRQLWLRIIGPVALTVLIMIAVLVLIVIPLTPHQVGDISAFAFVMVVSPFVLLCFIPYAALIAMAFALAKIYGKTSGWLLGARQMVRNANTQVERLSKVVAAPVITFNAWFARLESMVGIKPVSELPSRLEEKSDGEQ